MLNAFFALAHSEFGISHFTTDLILTVSAAMLFALPATLLRPHMPESAVKTKINS